MIGKWLFREKARSRWCPSQTITDVSDDDDIVLLANAPPQVESQLYSLEKAAGGIGLYVNADKTEYMCFNQNQTRDISTLASSSLKLVDKFTHIGAVSHLLTMISILTKTWLTIDWLSVIWKSDLSDKNKTQFFLSSGHVLTTIWMRHMDAN